MTMQDYIDLFGGQLYEGRDNIAYIKLPEGGLSEFIFYKTSYSKPLLTISYQMHVIELYNPSLEQAKKAFELLGLYPYLS